MNWLPENLDELAAETRPPVTAADRFFFIVLVLASVSCPIGLGFAIANGALQ